MMQFSPYVTRLVLPIHGIGILALILITQQFAWWIIPTIWFAWFLIGGIGVEIGLHRLYSHNAFRLQSPVMRWLVGWLSCLGGQWSPVWWASLHRGYHHPFSDLEKDIHSPTKGKWHAFMGWMFKLKPNDVSFRYAKDLLRDPMHSWLHKNYLGIVWITMIVAWLFYPLLGAILTIAILLAMHQENLVNVVCHDPQLGYRNYEIPDLSRNIGFLGLLLWGQGYHNNHHAFPRAYDFAVASREIDICRWVVPALVWIDRRLAKLFP